MIHDHALALLVVLPLLAAPLCVLIGRGVGAWAAAFATASASFGLALYLLNRVLASGPVSYEMGGWEAPVGIAFQLDAAGALVMTVITGIGALVVPYSWRSVQREIDEHKHHWFYACLMLCFSGLLGMTVTADAFNLFVFLEISSLSTYVLVSMGRDRRAYTAAFRYLLVGTVGATFYLLGIGFLFMLTGTLNMADMAQRLTEPAWNGGGLTSQTTTARAAFAFLTVGLSLKVAIWPLHLWLPNVYTYAPSSVSAFLSATATKVAVLVMLRVFYTIDGLAAPFATLPIADTLVPLALVGALSASLMAIYQDNLKRALAYSSVAQVGYIVLGIGLASASGLSASLLHLFNHALMKGALFCAMGCIVYRVGSARVEDVRGAGRAMPWTSTALVLGGLSLVGVPLTAGFVSKWALIVAILEQERWLTAVLLLMSSLLAVVYVGRILNIVLLSKRPESAPKVKEAPSWMVIPMIVLALMNVWFGIFGESSSRLAHAAAVTLMGAQQ
ncbi:MAG: monovalent cation/H+ antiporter subunit D family protein [Planctomycetota bacterium]